MGKYIPDYEIFEEVNKIITIADKKMEELIPEDTFDLQNDRKVQRAFRNGNRIEASVYIDPTWPSAEYAEYVEYGTWDTKRYYKDSGRLNGGTPFLVTGNGAQFVTKTRRYLEDNIL